MYMNVSIVLVLLQIVNYSTYHSSYLNVYLFVFANDFYICFNIFNKSAIFIVMYVQIDSFKMVSYHIQFGVSYIR